MLPHHPLTSLRALSLGPARRWFGSIEPVSRDPSPRSAFARDGKLAQVEAALFIADEPLLPRRLAQIAGLQDANEARRLVRKLHDLLEQEGSAFQVEEVAGGYQLLTRKAFHPWLARWRQSGPEVKLSSAARETLAIVAYRQPIMRADIEELRGVQCGELLRLLMEKGLVRIVGRHQSLGRPVLYGTTRKFLVVFGLKGLEELPLAEQLRQPAVKAKQVTAGPADESKMTP